MIKYLTLFAVYLLDFTIHQRNISRFLKNKFDIEIKIVFDVGAHKAIIQNFLSLYLQIVIYMGLNQI